VKEVHKVHRGLDAAALSLAGIQRRRSGSVGRLRREATQILKAMEGLKSYDDAAVGNEIVEIRSCFARVARPDKSQIRRALSLVCLLSQRSMGLTPFPVQVMGALALHRGFLAEMATGEGKTLTVALAAALAGWTGKPCHVITANDYLASRDAEWLGRFYAACSLTVGCVTGEMQPIDRAHGYRVACGFSSRSNRARQGAQSGAASAFLAGPQ
jgi:preprotein translocase subunit SecA